MSEMKPHIREKADELKGEIKVGKDGTVEVSDDFFEKSLAGTDLTLDVVKKVQKHTAETMAVAGLIVGEKALPIMVKNEKLDRVSGSANFGRDRVTVQYDRTANFTNPQNPKEPIVQHGVLSAKYKVMGTGALNSVREHLRDVADKQFG